MHAHLAVQSRLAVQAHRTAQSLLAPSWIVIGLLIGSAARADDLSWTVTAPSSSNSPSAVVYGTEFTPSVDLQVTSLGYYDDTLSSPDGLSVAHAVGIYRVDTQQLIVSATVPAGTTAPKTNYFRFVSVTPVTLQASVAYIVAGVVTGDPRRNVTPGTSMMVNPLLTLGPWKAAYTSTLSCPTTFVTDTTRSVGPAFTFAPAVANRLLWTLDPVQQATENAGLLGTEFTPTANLTVKSLGWYDDTYITPDGLSAAHPVGIFNALSGALLVSGTVPAGTSAPKANQFRMINVASTRLRAGVPYVVAAVGAGDPGRNVTPGNDMHLDALVTLGPWRSGLGTTFAFPANVSSTSSRFMGATAGFEPVAPVLAWDAAPPTSVNISTGVMGTEFTPKTAIVVSSLGWYDDTAYSPDGLATSHPVAIYRISDQAVVASSTLPAGTGTRKVSCFRFVDITPVTLQADVAYVVAGLFDGDGRINITPGATMTVYTPALTLGPWRMGGSTMGFPDFVSSATTRTVGPTFEFAPPVLDSDQDGVPDLEDLCPGTPAGTPVDAGGCVLQIPGDFNGDLRVDMSEMMHLIACVSGPEVAFGTGCANADLDQDGDVDQADFGKLQRCFSGTALANPACAY